MAFEKKSFPNKGKSKRTVIGSIIKGQDGKTDYIKFSQDINISNGDTFSLDSKSESLKRVQTAKESGKLSEEIAAEIEERINKIPDFVRFNIVKISKEA
jgi:hypothetical protein